MCSETLSGPHTRGFPIPLIIERPLTIAVGRGITVSAFNRVSDVTPIYMETLVISSCRRMPASSLLKTLDPGMRRDDDEVINQGFHKYVQGNTLSIVV